MFIIKGIFSGIIATIFFDIFQISLSYAYNVKKSKWNLIGRYFFFLFKEKKYYQEDIESENFIKNELLIGYVVHYLIGSIFGIFYVALNIINYDNPSFFLAIFVGIITVLGSWCIIMPFAFNIGFFALKKNNNKQLMMQNLIAHFIFGTGLFVGYKIIF
tara:strand:+ start:816 stop:1292 length:477 start_codon:yes stop_codon:yes gene_type:complete